MQRLPLRAFLSPALLALAATTCSSSAPPAKQPETSNAQKESSSPVEQEPARHADGQSAGSAGGGETPTPSVKVEAEQGDESNVIPDDYTLMRGDCALLGNKLGSVVRSDHMALLSPKLSEEKRAAAEKNIEDVAAKLAAQWTKGCESSLVDKVVERKRINCALDARSMKAFEECINPPLPKK